MPVHQTYVLGVLLVFLKYCSHSAVEFLPIHQHVALKVVLQASEVKVCGACGHKIVIYYHRL